MFVVYVVLRDLGIDNVVSSDIIATKFLIGAGGQVCDSQYGCSCHNAKAGAYGSVCSALSFCLGRINSPFGNRPRSQLKEVLSW